MVNFRNQRRGRHLAADYLIIMSRTLKVTGDLVTKQTHGVQADNPYIDLDHSGYHKS